MLHSTAWKMSKYGVCSGPYFPVFVPEKTPYLGTFHAALFLILSIFLWIILPPANKLIWCHTSKKNQQQWFLTEISFSKIEIKFGLFYALFQEYGLKNFTTPTKFPAVIGLLEKTIFLRFPSRLQILGGNHEFSHNSSSANFLSLTNKGKSSKKQQHIKVKISFIHRTGW